MEKLVKISDIEKLIQDKLLKNKEYLEGVNPRSPIFLIDSERYKSKISVLEILLSELSSLPTQNEWIPVSERLPEEGQIVLIELRRKGISYHTRIFQGGEFCDSECGFGMAKSYPVRWMPLPLPPTN